MGFDVNFDDRKVAIKILRKRRISRKIRDGINKIYREFELLNGLDHDCIVKYYDLIETNYDEDQERKACNNGSESNKRSTCDNDPTKSDTSSTTSSSLASYSSAGIKDGKMYLVMEWLGDGCNLTTWTSTPKQVNLDQIREILKKLLEGLEYLRVKEISHHDIKLDNIIYDEVRGTVKIIDFGVSEHCPKDESYCAYGTPAYQAPEILQRSDPSKPLSGHKMDMWSLGIVAYQLGNLQSKLPFEGDSVMQVFDSIINDSPDYSLIQCKELKDLVKGLLKKNPKNRLSAIEALNHSFFTVKTPQKKPFVYSNILGNVTDFIKSIFK